MNLSEIPNEPQLVWIGLNRPCPADPACELPSNSHHRCLRALYHWHQPYYCTCMACTNGRLYHYFKSKDGTMCCADCLAGNHPTAPGPTQ